MAIYQVPILKAKKSIEVDSSKLHEDIYAYALQLGMKSIANRLSKIKKEDFGTEEDYQSAAFDAATKLVESMYSGKGIRMVGVKAKAKTAGAEKTEARRIAREVVKSQIKAAGEKLKDYSAADITEAADALIEANPEILAEAKANLAARVEKAEKLKVNVAAIAKTAKPAKPKASPKAEGQLSAKQAAIPTKGKPAQPVTAH
jgi:hypothetical protein